MSRPNKNIIGIGLFDFEIEPASFTKLIGLDATSVAYKGNPITERSSKLLSKSNAWSYNEVSNTNEFIGDLLDDFLSRIVIPRKEELKKASSISHAEFQVVQYYYDGCNPGFHFSKTFLSVINEIGFEIDIDLYCLENTSEST